LLYRLDIQVATRTGTFPRLPLIRPSFQVHTRVRKAVDAEDQPLKSATEPGSNLAVLEDISKCLYTYLVQMLFLTAEAELFRHDLLSMSLARRLVEGRNAVQHGLLSLSTRIEDLRTSKDTALTEMCRIAALIYSDMVLFPLP
jgi:hypothetical protein